LTEKLKVFDPYGSGRFEMELDAEGRVVSMTRLSAPTMIKEEGK